MEQSHFNTEIQRMSFQESLKKVSDQAIRLSLTKTDDRLFYHNLAHTVRFLNAISKMNGHYQLDDRNYFIVCASAWLYGLEMIASGYESHESKTTDLVQELLISLGIDSEEITEIKNCILATKMPQQPVTLNEKIVCDAYAFYLGSEKFAVYNKLMRKEIEAFTNNKFKGSAWRARTISLLKNHHYHTEFCQTLLNKPKEENLQAIIRLQEEKLWQRQLDNEIRKQKRTIHELLGNTRLPETDSNSVNPQSTSTNNFLGRA